MRKLIFLSLIIIVTGCSTYQTIYDGKIAHNEGRYERAVSLWTIAAEDGDHWAQYYLGRSYRKGEGVTKDYRKAFFWFKKSAEKNNLKALNELGVMYRKGRGVVQNNRTALTYYYRAARASNGIAMRNIGYFYRRGIDVVKVDYVRAYFWYSLALKLGDEKASNRRDSFEYLLTKEEILDIKQRIKFFVITDLITEPFFEIKELSNEPTEIG